MLIRVDDSYSGGPSIEARTLRVAAAYRDQDEARRAYLDHVIKTGGTCRFCGGELTDKVMARTPGTCSRRSCRRSARRAARLAARGEAGA